MIRSHCVYQENGRRCGKVTRARIYHKYCRAHHLAATGTRRPIPHQTKKARVIKPKFDPPIEKKDKKKK